MKLDDFSLLEQSEANPELALILGDFKGRRREYPAELTTHAIFSKVAARAPESIAARDERATLTYGELEARSNQLARCLIERGLAPNTFAAILLNRSVDVVVSILAILKSGAAYLPLDPGIPLQRTQFLIEDARATFLISERQFIREMNRLQWECQSLRDVLCLDSFDFLAEIELPGEIMNDRLWDQHVAEAFDDISVGGWKSSYTGELLSRQVMDEYGENIRQKLDSFITEDSRILEIGCSSGISMFRLAPRAQLYYGTDLSRAAIQWAEKERQRLGLANIRLQRLAAHEIDLVQERDFDIVIINSVIECFPGHNYCRDVLRKALGLMKPKGIIFLGNVWDQDKKDSFVDSLEAFRRENRHKAYQTKVDRTGELFLSRRFLEDLMAECAAVRSVEFSTMLGSALSELSEFGFDALLRIDQTAAHCSTISKQKFQFDRKAFATQPGHCISERSGPRQLAYVMHTSGTSGQPKGVMVEHRSILRLVLNTDYHQCTASDRIMQMGALAFDASTFEIWGPLLNGGTICFAGDETLRSPVALDRALESFGITTLFLTTGLFNLLAGSDLRIFRHLKTVLTGGERVSVHHVNRVRTTYPSLHLYHVYGPTENTTFTTAYPVSGACEQDIPIGRPLANSTAYILDGNLKPLPIGVPGELFVGGDGLARGYLNDPSLTDMKFICSPFDSKERLYRTGDLVRWLQDGNIQFLRRIDEQVKVRGFRIEPAEIENRIMEYPGVRDAVVLARDMGSGTLDLIAYVAGPPELNHERLREHLTRRVPDYMLPAFSVYFDQLPLGPGGKVDKKNLPLPRRPSSDGQQRPRNEIEAKLLAIWEEVLGQNGLDVSDNFFEFGGHSLKITKILAMLHQTLGVELPVSTIFKAPTVRQLADRIMDRAKFGHQIADDSMILLSGNPAHGRVFAFPPGTGDALGFVQMAALIQPYAVYAFNFLESESRIREYADLVTSIDSNGPYVLLGYSSGGNLAFRVASELEGRGLKITEIIMIDSSRKIAKFSFPPEEVDRVAAAFLSHESIRPAVANPVLREKALRRIRRNYEFIGESIDGQTVCTNISLLNGDDSVESFSDKEGTLISSMAGWADAISGHLRRYRIRGGHNDLLAPPHLEANSAVVLDILHRIFRGTGNAEVRPTIVNPIFP